MAPGSVDIDPWTGRVLDDRYRIEERIGAGGMGVVYGARHLHLQQKVAIKVMASDRASDPDMCRRFAREARSSFRFDHPNCVKVVDFGATEDGMLFMVMEHLDGRTAAHELAVDGPLASARVGHIAGQCAQALEHAHGLGLLHRDLKPANLMLLHRGSDPDFVKVFDFGLAKLVDDGTIKTALSMSPLTQQGHVFGTPEYVSPEQAQGLELTSASDVYSLGVCCYELLTGEVPFRGPTFTATLSQHVLESPIPPRARRPDLEIDAALEALVVACLEKDPRDRPTVTKLIAGLTEKQTQRPRAVSAHETLELGSAASIHARALQEPPTVSLRPRPVRASAQMPPSTPRRARLFAAVGLAAVATTMAIFVFAGRSETSAPGVDTAVSFEKTGTTDAGARVAKTLVDAAPPLADLDATPPRVEAGAPPKAAPAQDPHLLAAERARRSGNLLKQLAEANAALKASPKSRRAAFLVGEALFKSGDKVRGCAYLKRSSHRQWRAAGCID